MTCQFCGGKKVVAAPNGSAYQACPLCNGTGKDQSGAIPFAYNFESPVIGALGVLNGQTIIINNGDFTVLFLMAQSTGAFKVQWSDKGKNRPFSEVQIDSRNMFGTAQNPFPLLTPYTFSKGGIMGLDFTDLSNANNTIRVTFFGVTIPA